MREQIPINIELDGYQITDKLWSNRLGTLYKATELESRRTVGIQTFSSVALEQPFHPEDLISHIEGLSGMLHPNIVETHSLKLSSEGPFLVQEYVPGYRLDEYLAQKGALHWQLSLRIIRQLLSALEYAHDSNFLHHRLDPKNIIIARGNTAKIMQFGIEHLVAGNSYRMPERLISDPGSVYTAPEHYNEAERGDFSSDLYSLGLIAHEIITGKHLLGDSTLSFEGYSPFIANRTRFLEAIHPPLPDQLLNAVETALERNPTRRFQAAEAMTESLNGIEVETAKPRIKYHTSHGLRNVIPKLTSTPTLITVVAFIILMLAAYLTVLPQKKNPFTALGGNKTESARTSRSLPQRAEATLGAFAEEQMIPVRIRAVDKNNRSVRGEIFVDGESVNAYTPTTLNMRTGSYTVEVKAQGFKHTASTQKITVRQERTRPVTLEIERD